MPAGRAPERSIMARSFDFLLGEAAVDHARVVNRLLDDGHFLHLVVQHDGQVVADVGPVKSVELAGRLRRSD